jgi:hypothetical protein
MMCTTCLVINVNTVSVHCKNISSKSKHIWPYLTFQPPAYIVGLPALLACLSCLCLLLGLLFREVNFCKQICQEQTTSLRYLCLYNLAWAAEVSCKSMVI